MSGGKVTKQWNGASTFALTVSVLVATTASPQAFSSESSHLYTSTIAASPSHAQKRMPVPELPLDDLYDVGYILQLIKQQAADIYVEATRKKDASALFIAPLGVIPEGALLPESQYKPLRKAWLVFFIGTMEPLVQLLEEGWREVNSGAVELKVPKDKSPAMDRLLSEMGNSLHAINKHLNNCAEVLDTNDSGNLIVAREAAGIASEVAKAEKIRAQTITMFGNLGEPGTVEYRN